MERVLNTEFGSPETVSISEKNEGSSISKPSSLRQVLLRGVSALGAATLLERSLTYTANLFAARWGGPQIFGAYSLSLTTANTVATYSGMGIGTVATRFSGDYPPASSSYRKFVTSLAKFAMASAALAAIVLYFGFGIFGGKLSGAQWSHLLRLAALPAAAAILLECLRGFLIGQKRYAFLILLSAFLGGGLLLALPAAARTGASLLILSYGAVTGIAVAGVVFCIFIREAKASRVHESESGAFHFLPLLKFGMAQLAAVVALGISTWWIAILVSRSDPSLKQMGFYAVGNQFRSIAAILPGLFSQIGYPLFTERASTEFGGSRRVLAVSTVVITTLVLLFAGGAVLSIFWILPHLYGNAYSGALSSCAILLATAVVHMSGAPVAQRLTIVSLKSYSIVNFLWAATLLTSGFLLIPKYGAAGAALGFLSAHTLANLGNAACLIRIERSARHVFKLSFHVCATAILIAILAVFRFRGVIDEFIFWVGIVGLIGGNCVTLYFFALRNGLVLAKTRGQSA